MPPSFGLGSLFSSLAFELLGGLPPALNRSLQSSSPEESQWSKGLASTLILPPEAQVACPLGTSAHPSPSCLSSPGPVLLWVWLWGPLMQTWLRAPCTTSVSFKLWGKE